MPMVKRIVCLAISRKTGGLCVAGKELINGQPAGWIRPISDRKDEEVSIEECRYENGGQPELLDIIDVPLIEPRPKNPQRENWLLDPNFHWKKEGTVNSCDLKQFIDPVDQLWINESSTVNGLNDRILGPSCNGLNDSLYFIKVDKLFISVFRPGQNYGDCKRRVQGRFHYCSTEYRLWITDPEYERAYLAKPDGIYEVGKQYLTVSLAGNDDGHCYKLIAAVIQCGEPSKT